MPHLIDNMIAKHGMQAFLVELMTVSVGAGSDIDQCGDIMLSEDFR